jgi:hypothetical protein
LPSRAIKESLVPLGMFKFWFLIQRGKLQLLFTWIGFIPFWKINSLNSFKTFPSKPSLVPATKGKLEGSLL